jgi:hypothetical protein
MTPKVVALQVVYRKCGFFEYARMDARSRWHAGGQGFESPQLHPFLQVSGLRTMIEYLQKIQ